MPNRDYFCSFCERPFYSDKGRMAHELFCPWNPAQRRCFTCYWYNPETFSCMKDPLYNRRTGFSRPIHKGNCARWEYRGESDTNAR